MEGERLNPASRQLLPFESFHEVGQNVKAASSIGATQHSQINRSSLRHWPILQLQVCAAHISHPTCMQDGDTASCTTRTVQFAEVAGSVWSVYHA